MRAVTIIIAGLAMFSASSSAQIYRDPKVVAAFKASNPAPGASKMWHVDHVIPLACGGPDHVSNLQYLRAVDNLRKGAVGCKRGMPIHNAIQLVRNSHKLASPRFAWETTLIGGQLVIVGYGFYAGTSAMLEHTEYGREIVNAQSSQTVEPIVEYTKRVVPANRAVLETLQDELADSLCYFSSSCL